MPMWGYYDASGMGWWVILSSLFWLALAAVVVWAVVRWLSSNTSRSPAPRTPYEPPQMSALDILKARYARGEIDADTYQAMRAQLEETPPTPTRTPQEPIPSGR
jgi:putative membrane protein